jgi:hypothetical protein
MFFVIEKSIGIKSLTLTDPQFIQRFSETCHTCLRNTSVASTLLLQLEKQQEQ